jgi:hypothetical protein
MEAMVAKESIGAVTLATLNENPHCRSQSYDLAFKNPGTAVGHSAVEYGVLLPFHSIEHMT